MESQTFSTLSPSCLAVWFPISTCTTNNYTPMTASTDETYNLKLLLIGDSSVGKSSLLLRFSDQTWLPEDESSAT